MRLRDLFKGTSAHPLPPARKDWHPLDVDLCNAAVEAAAISRAAAVIGPDAAPDHCTAPTKTGNPCKRAPRPGTDRCVLPAHQRA